MDRKEFLRGCATGLCACAAACLPKGAAAAAANAPKPEDWRLPFVKQRYAKLIGVLSKRMDEKTLSASLQDVGNFCAAQDDNKINKFRGDLDGYCKELAKSGTAVVRDDARKIYIVSGTPQADCFCPLNSVAAKTPGAACECTLGWNRHNWSIVLQKEPKVVLLESILRGGNICKVEITAA
jgi:hypothetical protein